MPRAIGVGAIALAWPWLAAQLSQRLASAGVGHFMVLCVVFTITGAIGWLAWTARRKVPALAEPATPVRQWIVVVAAATLAFVVAAGTQMLETGAGEAQVAERTAAVVLAAIAGATVVPVTEELVYRGVIYQALRHRLVGPLPRWPEGAVRFVQLVPAIVISSLLFGVSHYEVATLGGIGSLVLFGAVMALAYEFTGRLWVPMLTHAAYNLILGLGDLGFPTITGSLAVAAMVIVAAALAISTGPPAPIGFIGSGRDLHPFRAAESPRRSKTP